MNDSTLTALNHAHLHIKQAVEALDDTHLLDDERLDDAYRDLITLQVTMRDLYEEYDNIDKQDWDTDIGDY